MNSSDDDGQYGSAATKQKAYEEAAAKAANETRIYEAIKQKEDEEAAARAAKQKEDEEAAAKAASEKMKIDAAAKVQYEVALDRQRDSEVDNFQRGYNLGFKAGYLGGYQTGKADVLSNQTTTMTNISQGLAEILQNNNEKSAPEERSPIEENLALIILATGLFLSLLISIPVYKSKNKQWQDNSIRLLGIVWVIIGGLVLLPVGYSEQQIAPLWAMLGTIAGYLLAKF